MKKAIYIATCLLGLPLAVAQTFWNKTTDRMFPQMNSIIPKPVSTVC